MDDDGGCVGYSGGKASMMLASVSVDSKLLAAAMAIKEFRTKRATDEYALWVYIRTKDPQAALELRETLNWGREVAAKSLLTPPGTGRGTRPAWGVVEGPGEAGANHRALTRVSSAALR
jgi:hypothetical protein